MHTRRLLIPLSIGALLLALSWGVAGEIAPARPAAQSSFASEIAALSEPGGYFDTDNLISNERSYVDVVPDLKKRGVRGGAYIGVGPDQNFTYIAAIRPDVAFIVDVRRDNLLLHLLFKSLFALARTRVEYLALLLGRPVPTDIESWRSAPIDRVVAQAEVAALEARGVLALRRRVEDALGKVGVPLSQEDLSTIDRFHRRFIEGGLGLRFQSTGRPPQSHYPTFRDLLLATDAFGERSNYLASEDSFQFIKSLHKRDAIVPVVGDLSGPRALAAIGTLLGQRGQRLSAFYASNVEFYLFSDDRFDRFVANLGRLPRTGHGVIIRSVFGRYARGGGSTSQLQPVTELVDGFSKGRFRYYGELVDRSSER
jgi:hypothetical protein